MKKQYLKPNIQVVSIAPQCFFAASDPAIVTGGTGTDEIVSDFADSKRNDLWDFSDSGEE